MSEPTPTPGSVSARSQGCSCSRSDNHNGEGAGVTESGKPMWWMERDCPLHGSVSSPMPRDAVTGDLFDGDAT